MLRGAPSSLVVEWVLLVTLNILERRAVRVKQESETDDRISYFINIHGGRRRRAGFYLHSSCNRAHLTNGSQVWTFYALRRRRSDPRSTANQTKSIFRSSIDAQA